MAIIALANPVYKPAMRGIIAIARNNPIIIATTLDGVTFGPHGYIDGLIVRLDIPPGWGMFQANQLFGSIIVTGPTTFIIPSINSTSFDVYTAPATFPENRQIGQCVPIGEDNGMLTGATFNQL